MMLDGGGKQHVREHGPSGCEAAASYKDRCHAWLEIKYQSAPFASALYMNILQYRESNSFGVTDDLKQPLLDHVAADLVHERLVIVTDWRSLESYLMREVDVVDHYFVVDLLAVDSHTIGEKNATLVLATDLTNWMMRSLRGAV